MPPESSIVVTAMVFRDAREFFDAVRDASRDADRIRLTLERMGVREQVRAQGYEPRGRGGDRDAMAATDRRMDYEARIRRRQKEDYALIDAACDLIYGVGQDGRGGICALLSPAHADALWWRFCAHGTWAEVAAGSGMSESWCRTDGVPTAIDCVDGLGIGRVTAGLGVAEDM